MSEFVLNWYLRLFDRLSPENKASLIKKLVDRLSVAPKSLESEKLAALEKLSGAWANLDIDADAIVAGRTNSDRMYDLWVPNSFW